MTRWLHLAAAPTFAVMALVNAASDSSAPMAFCSAQGGPALGGMAPMYLLMAVFHAAPWLKLIAQRGGLTPFATLNRSGDIQTMEQKP